MKIRDLNLNQYVVVKDLGAGKYSSGMRVIGKVVEIDPCGNFAVISSLPDHNYEITDFNDFELWSKQIENKTEHIGSKKNSGRVFEGWAKDLYEDRKHIEDNFDKLHQKIYENKSNDVQQRKRNKKIVQWSDDIKLKFIERVIQDLSPLAAYHIGNAIDVLAVAESKEDIEQARWSIQRAFENWDVK